MPPPLETPDDRLKFLVFLSSIHTISAKSTIGVNNYYACMQIRRGCRLVYKRCIANNNVLGMIMKAVNLRRRERNNIFEKDIFLLALGRRSES